MIDLQMMGIFNFSTIEEKMSTRSFSTFEKKAKKLKFESQDPKKHNCFECFQENLPKKKNVFQVL